MDSVSIPILQTRKLRPRDAGPKATQEATAKRELGLGYPDARL